MHESHLLEKIFQYLDTEEQRSCRKIKKVCISLSEFGGISEAHFREHCACESKGTKWEAVEFQVTRIPFGPELEITRIEFV